jgi:hypothetical protein
MTALDAACLYGRLESVNTLVSKIDDEDLKVILTRRNHGLRTTLSHCTYYEDNTKSGCREVIVRILQTLGLGHMVDGSTTLKFIKLL